jgi:hypothetical protein
MFLVGCRLVLIQCHAEAGTESARHEKSIVIDGLPRAYSAGHELIAFKPSRIIPVTLSPPQEQRPWL